jgi:TM2 domain-containing membrane protein YozV
MMMILISLFVLIFSTTGGQNITSRQLTDCATEFSCLHGECRTIINKTSCVCDRGWTISRDNPPSCSYPQKSKLAAFLLSFFVGGFGADWFYLSVGNGGYIAAGVFKMLTLGGIGIWWLVDWIRILTNSFPDGQNYALLEWSP